MALYTEKSLNDLSGLFASEERRRQNLLRQQQEQALQEYNTQKNNLDKKYESDNGGLGGFLGGIVGGIGKGIGDVGKGLFDLFGSAGASVRDLGSYITTGKSAGEAEKFKKWLYDTDDLGDAYAKSAGTALNAATNIATTALPVAGAGGAIGKAASGAVANTAAGALGGVADELQQQGKDASMESATNRALSGAAAGLATAGLNRKIGNASSNLGSKILNNNVTTSTLGRGALSGAVGGSVGAGTSAALAGQDVGSAALQGGLTGAIGGATQAGLVSGARKLGTTVTDRLGVTDKATNTNSLRQENLNKGLSQNAENVNLDEQSITSMAGQRNTRNTNQQELSTSMAGQLRKRSAEKLLDQYGTIDKPMARSASAIENVQKVADAGFERPADVEKMIGYITGDGGKVTKLTRQLVTTAKPVNTFDGLDSIIDDQVALHGLVDSDAKSVRSTLEAQFNRLPSRREGSVSYTDNAEDVFDVVKALEKRSADLKGKSGNNYRNTTPERADKAAVLDAVAEVLKDRIYSGAAPMDKILTQEVRQDLINYAPKNKKWQNYVDNTIMKARDIGELRSSVAPFVNMGKIIENQYMNYGTYGQRVGDSAREVGNAAKALFKVPVAGQIAEAAANSNIAKRAMSKAYSKAADIVENRPRAVETEIDRPRAVETEIATGKTQNSTTQLIDPYLQRVLGNYLGRTAGEQQANDNIQALRRAQDYKNLEDMFGDISSSVSSGTMMGDNIVGSSSATIVPQNAATNQMVANLNDISTAMDIALSAGDITSYNQLADLYKSAYNMYQIQTEMSGANSKSTKLSSTQQSVLRDLDTSENTLSQLKEAYQLAGGAQGIAGNLSEFGNFLTGGAVNRDLATYNSLKNSLGSAIIKNVINLGGTEQDAKRYTDMLPSASDSPQQAEQKFAYIEQMLNNARQSVYNNA